MTRDFDWAQPYARSRQPVFGRNVVSTSHPLAAQAGLRMLQAGGNAVDASARELTSLRGSPKWQGQN